MNDRKIPAIRSLKKWIEQHKDQWKTWWLLANENGDLDLSKDANEVRLNKKFSAPTTTLWFVEGVGYQDVVREWRRMRYLTNERNVRRNVRRKLHNQTETKTKVSIPRVPRSSILHYISTRGFQDKGHSKWTMKQLGKINDFYEQLVKRVMDTASANTYIKSVFLGGNCNSTQNRYPTLLVVLLAKVYGVSRPFALLVVQWLWHNAAHYPDEDTFYNWWRLKCNKPDKRGKFCSNDWCKAVVLWYEWGLDQQEPKTFLANVAGYSKYVNNGNVKMAEFDGANSVDSDVQHLWGLRDLNAGISGGYKICETSMPGTRMVFRCLESYSTTNPTNALKKKLNGLFAEKGQGKQPGKPKPKRPIPTTEKMMEAYRGIDSNPNTALIWIDLIDGVKKTKESREKNALECFDVYEIKF